MAKQVAFIDNEYSTLESNIRTIHADCEEHIKHLQEKSIQ